MLQKRIENGDSKEEVLIRAGLEGEAFVARLHKKRRRRTIRSLLLLLILCIISLGGMLYLYWNMYRQVPGKLFFVQGREQHITLGVPVTGQVAEVNAGYAQAEVEVLNLAVENDLHIAMEKDYSMAVKLFGIFPVKEVPIKLLEEKKVLPIGYPVGMYIDTKGVLVTQVGAFTQENGEQCMPVEKILQKGDYILEIDGQKVESKEDFSQKVSACEGKTLVLLIDRGGEQRQVSVQPEKTAKGEYKLGIWIKDDMQGVGTVTYLDESGRYAALGHAINDGETGNIFTLEEGSIYQTEIVETQKSIPGNPGQMTGLIVYNQERELGSLQVNCKKGIFGICSKDGMEYLKEHASGTDFSQWRSIGLRQEAELGEAYIICTVEEEPEMFSIEITAIHLDGSQADRDIEFLVTDEGLLKQTGGIVQGMSGSPIIQKDKLIGAVTHVFVNDPTKGYGLFIEEMVEQSSQLLTDN